MNNPSRTWNGAPWPSGSVIERVALLDGPAPFCFVRLEMDENGHTRSAACRAVATVRARG